QGSTGQTDSYQGETDHQEASTDYNDYSSDLKDTTSSGDAGYVEETPTWQESDWVTANADGSVQVALPEGVNIDQGVASFPVDIANESLPIPEGVTIQTDGSVNVALPEGSEYNAETGTLMLSQNSELAQSIPDDVPHFTTPDGDVRVTLPEDGVTYNAETNMLNISNDCVNDMAPSNVEFAEDGSVNVQLPEGTELNADGSVNLSAEQADWMNNPPPEYAMEGPDWVDGNPDGSVTMTPPEGVEVNPDAGTMTMSVEAVTEHFEEQIPDDVTLNQDGTMNIGVPDGTQYDMSTRMLTLPEGEMPNPQDTPPEFNAHLNADGTTSLTLPEGVDYNATDGSVHFDNYWTNQVAQYEHPNIEISPEGQIEMSLPTGTEYHDDGSFTIPSEQADFVSDPNPDYACNGPQWVSVEDSGAIKFEPPAQVQIDGDAGTMTMPIDVAVEHFEAQIPDDVTLNPDGTANMKLPDGAEYDAAGGTLTVPAGEIKDVAEIPPAFNPQMAADGTVTVTLPEGVDYQVQTGELHFDNYWTNEMAHQTYPSVEITPEGAIVAQLPPTTEYHADGSFTVPEAQADFLTDPVPDYVAEGPEFVAPNPDGSVTWSPSPDVQVNPTEGTISMSVDSVQEYFKCEVPDEVTFNNDGTMSIEVPTGVAYDAASATLTMPVGEIHDPTGIPQEFNPQYNADGSFSVTLPQGCNYDADTGSVNIDNYWTNEIVQYEHPNVEIATDGQMTASLPPGTEYYDNGSFTVPTEHADFIGEPAPDYVMEGPAWVEIDAQGAVTMTPPDGIEVNPDGGTMNMSVEAMTEHFKAQIPDEVTLNPDGTMNIEVPQGTAYNADAGTLTIPAGEITNIAEIPPTFMPQMDASGVVTVTMPAGVTFDPAQGELHLDNTWTNEVIQQENPAVSIAPTGQVTVDLPPETAYYPDGSVTIPEGQADFVTQDPIPTYVAEGPDWVAQSSIDGGVAFTPPAEITVDAVAGTMSMPVDVLEQNFDAQIPDEVTLNNDGTMDYKLPDGVTYSAVDGTLTLPPGEIQNVSEIPPAFSPELGANGAVTVTLPPGVDYDATTMSVHFDNYWSNEVIHTEYPAVDISATGQVEVMLPPATEYGTDGSFTVPAEQADFVENPAPAYVCEGPAWVDMSTDGSVTWQPPTDITVDPQAGTMTMPLDAVETHFELQIPETVTFNENGTMTVEVPQGTAYNAATGTLMLPDGAIHDPASLPSEFNPISGPDGAYTVTLPQGCQFDPAAQTVTFDNYWTNEIVQQDHPNIEISPSGSFEVGLPPGTQYYQDGSFSVPPQHADFIGEPAPAYVMEGPDWSSYNGDGSVTFTPPPEVNIDSSTGMMTMPVDYANVNMGEMIPEGVEFHADGSMTMPCPDGCQYNADAGTLMLPPGELHPNDIPEGVNYTVAGNGALTVTLPEGMDYNTAENTITFNNQWTNEVVPSQVEVGPTGVIQVQLPPETQYYDNGSAMIPPYQTDFLNYGAPPA
ncbi:MAG: hypothetical protein AABZ06_11265, partial [Bdellovibrionota bacterium]